jgi:hypothetical protein
MSSRILLSCYAAPIKRCYRRDDGRLFGVLTASDTDRGSPRPWTVYVNDAELLKKFEKLKAGEPISISGPFSVTLNGERLVYRVTADALISARKERKKRAKQETVGEVDPNDAPKDDDSGGRPFDDDLPF